MNLGPWQKANSKVSGSLSALCSGHAKTVMVFFGHLLIQEEPDHQQNSIFLLPLWKQAKQGKTRPLRASVANTKDLGEILKSAKKLRYSDAFNNVFINRDMTQLERSQWRKLMKEKRDKQEVSLGNGENVK